MSNLNVMFDNNILDKYSAWKNHFLKFKHNYLARRNSIPFF